MHLVEKDHVSPIATEHGEVVYEMIGRDAGEATSRHSVAHIIIPPGKSSRLHYHPEAEESYYILRGRAKMALDDESMIIEPGQIVLIPPKKNHQITNIGAEDLEFLAICAPAWEPNNSVYLDNIG